MHDILSQELTASQRKAVFHVEGPLLVLAGPGSGKTRVITYRIAALINSGVPPRNICAITFTNKAADQMRQRAVALGASGGAHISTFHSLCVRILRRYADNAGIIPSFSIYDESDQSRCMKQAVRDCELDTANFSPARMLEHISKLKNKLIDVDAFKMEADDFLQKTVARIYARYQHLLNENNALDFDDLLMKTAFLLRDCPDVCRQLADRFKFLLIDEYQDTNHAQYVIAKLLVTRHNNICATGDPDQSIYRWRGADIRNILDFENDWPDAAIVKLEENFRSAAGILEVADSLISFNLNRKDKKLIPTKPAGRDVVVCVCEDEIEEAETVTRRIKELTDSGASLKNIAVFYRVNAMSRLLEETFIRNKMPYQIVRGVEFYGRKEVRDVLAYLKVLVNPNDEIALLRIINTPARGIGKTTIDKARLFAAKNRIGLLEAVKKAERIDSLSEGTRAKLVAFAKMLGKFKKDAAGKVAPLVERIVNESGLAESLRTQGAQGQESLDNVKELINASAYYDQQTEQPSVTDYLQQISLFSDVDGYDTSGNYVALMTLHAAKGLEFENVFIVGVEDGLLPHAKTDSREDEDELEEERRLFFVGITRAKTGLFISYAKYRTIRGQMLRTIPSQFLFELGIDLNETDQGNQYYHNDADNIVSPVIPAHPPVIPAKFTCHSCGRAGIHYSVASFEPGQRVRHKFFGTGIIKTFIDMGENSVVVVKFNTGQTKTLMVKYADLSTM